MSRSDTYSTIFVKFSLNKQVRCRHPKLQGILEWLRMDQHLPASRLILHYCERPYQIDIQLLHWRWTRQTGTRGKRTTSMCIIRRSFERQHSSWLAFVWTGFYGASWPFNSVSMICNRETDVPLTLMQRLLLPVLQRRLESKDARLFYPLTRHETYAEVELLSDRAFPPW